MTAAARRHLAALGGRHIGPHLPLTPGLGRSAERAGAVGATAIQVFSDNPTAWRRKAEAPPGIDAFRARLAVLGVARIAVHASYLINLCGADEEFWRRSIDTLAAELQMGELYGAQTVNVHVGSHKGQARADGIARLAAGLREVFALVPSSASMPRLALENSAGAGDGIGSTLEDLIDIQEAAAQAGVEMDRLGFCLDTAHLWGAGYAIGDPDGVGALLDRLDPELGPGRLLMVHLNDSKAPRGSLRDRHEHIAAGGIGEVGMRAWLTHLRLQDVPAFLETPGMDLGYDKRNMDRVRRIIAGRELPRLPAAAFTLRGSRSRAKSAKPADDAADDGSADGVD